MYCVQSNSPMYKRTKCARGSVELIRTGNGNTIFVPSLSFSDKINVVASGPLRSCGVFSARKIGMLHYDRRNKLLNVYVISF